MELLDLLSEITVINRDNGKRFKDTSRLDRITSLLWNSRYRRINPDGLFHLYTTQPVEYYHKKDVVVVSSHIDCEKAISRCFSAPDKKGFLRGVYDNSITNAAILSLMLSGSLSDNVIIAFTGDEEGSCKGAKHLIKFLRSNRISVIHMFVLDVTDMGWAEEYDFTIENNFWHNDYGKKIIDIADSLSCKWGFVPEDPKNVPAFVSESNLIRKEAEQDETWYYDEKGINCCSLCLPIEGEMHSDEGVLVREHSFMKYAEALDNILNIQ